MGGGRPAGLTDRHGRLCLSFALWNERDPYLKERLFGLSGPEGNHGEDVKEEYFYLDALPSGAFLEALYKYPRRALLARRSRSGQEGSGIGSGVTVRLLDDTIVRQSHGRCEPASRP